MKEIYLIVIASLASWTVIIADEDVEKIPTKCPATDPKNSTVLFPHEHDCTKFYMCQRGKKILQECPKMNENGDRLHFNPRLGACDWPDHAGCKLDMNEEQAEVTNGQVILEGEKECDKEIPKKCPTTDPKNTTIHLAHENDCTKFYMCLRGEKILKLCPTMNEQGNRLHFNPCLQVCDWPDGGCKNGHNPDCPKDGHRLPYPCDCSKFFECKDDEKILRECPDNRYFSQKWQGCVKFEDSDCKKNNTEKECTKDGELLPHECKCEKYYKCSNNQKILQECKGGLHFSPKRRRCEDPKKAGCIRPPEPGYCSDSEYPRRHECDCRLYYECVDEKKQIHACHWGYYWNEKKRKCDYKENVSCENDWDD